jgi:hypothetical protein
MRFGVETTVAQLFEQAMFFGRVISIKSGSKVFEPTSDQKLVDLSLQGIVLRVALEP